MGQESGDEIGARTATTAHVRRRPPACRHIQPSLPPHAPHLRSPSVAAAERSAAVLQGGTTPPSGVWSGRVLPEPLAWCRLTCVATDATEAGAEGQCVTGERSGQVWSVESTTGGEGAASNQEQRARRTGGVQSRVGSSRAHCHSGAGAGPPCPPPSPARPSFRPAPLAGSRASSGAAAAQLRACTSPVAAFPDRREPLLNRPPAS